MAAYDWKLDGWIIESLSHEVTMFRGRLESDFSGTPANFTVTPLVEFNGHLPVGTVTVQNIYRWASGSASGAVLVLWNPIDQQWERSHHWPTRLCHAAIVGPMFKGRLPILGIITACQWTLSLSPSNPGHCPSTWEMVSFQVQWQHRTFPVTNVNFGCPADVALCNESNCKVPPFYALLGTVQSEWI